MVALKVAPSSSANPFGAPRGNSQNCTSSSRVRIHSQVLVREQELDKKRIAPFAPPGNLRYRELVRCAALVSEGALNVAGAPPSGSGAHAFGGKLQRCDTLPHAGINAASGAQTARCDVEYRLKDLAMVSTGLSTGPGRRNDPRARLRGCWAEPAKSDSSS